MTVSLPARQCDLADRQHGPRTMTDDPDLRPRLREMAAAMSGVCSRSVVLSSDRWQQHAADLRAVDRLLAWEGYQFWAVAALVGAACLMGVVLGMMARGMVG